MWIDSHCHLDAPEFGSDRDAVVQRAREAGVTQMLLPAVGAFDFDTVRELAHRHDLSYALGIHPLYVMQAADEDLDRLNEQLTRHRDDPRLMAVGEIGLDFFVEGLDADRQQRFYLAQLQLARRHGLPVVLHVRRSADLIHAGLRRVPVAGGIAHAFNGSLAQAQRLLDLGFKLGFGGALTFDRALQIRRLAQQVPAEGLVLETDAPDIPPHWLYKTAAERAAGDSSRNEPAELPRIAAVLAGLRGWGLYEAAEQLRHNTLSALPRLAALLHG